MSLAERNGETEEGERNRGGRRQESHITRRGGGGGDRATVAISSEQESRKEIKSNKATTGTISNTIREPLALG